MLNSIANHKCLARVRKLVWVPIHPVRGMCVFGTIYGMVLKRAILKCSISVKGKHSGNYGKPKDIPNTAVSLVDGRHLPLARLP